MSVKSLEPVRSLCQLTGGATEAGVAEANIESCRAVDTSPGWRTSAMCPSEGGFTAPPIGTCLNKKPKRVHKSEDWVIMKMSQYSGNLSWYTVISY